MRCPNCDNELREGEGLIREDITEPCMVCDECEEAFEINEEEI